MGDHGMEKALEWGLRASFLEYVDGIDDTHIDCNGVDRVRGGFRFPLAPRTVGEDVSNLLSTGSLTITAHRGFLRVLLRDPAVELGSGSYVLTADIGSPGRTVVCRLFGPRLEDESGLTYDAKLAEDGVRLFGDIYPVGTEMSPVRLIGCLPPGAGTSDV